MLQLLYVYLDSVQMLKKEEAIAEVKKMCSEKNIFEDYDWNIENCDESGINDFSETLKNEIIASIGKNLESCIEECA